MTDDTTFGHRDSGVPEDGVPGTGVPENGIPGGHAVRTPEDFMLFRADMLRGLGEDDQADALLRQLSQTRSPHLLHRIGTSWLRAGRPDECARVLRAALPAAAGTEDEMEIATNLGCALFLLGEEAEAEPHLRRGAALGSPIARQNLATVLRRGGDPEGAERVLRRAAADGGTGAILSLAHLLRADGRRREAWEWLRRAAATGLVEAAAVLGADLALDGPDQDLDEAEHWLTPAARSGDTSAEWRLGQLLSRRGEDEQARRWLTRAAEKAVRPQDPERTEADAEAAGEPGPAPGGRPRRLRDGTREPRDGGPRVVVGRGDVLTLSRDDDERAPIRQAAGAAFTLGALLCDQGESEEGRRWLRIAVEAGEPEAAVGLARMAGWAGDEAEQLRWYARAHELGHGTAAFHAGGLCGERGRAREAEDWYERSAAAGHGLAAANLAGMHGARGDLEGAERWYRRAVGLSGHPDADALVRRFTTPSDQEQALAEWVLWCARRGFPWAVEWVRDTGLPETA